MIKRIGAMIGPSNITTPVDSMLNICGDPVYAVQYVRAVPSPHRDGLLERIGDAWSVLRGHSHAVYWPKAGELEAALKRGEYRRLGPRSITPKV